MTVNFQKFWEPTVAEPHKWTQMKELYYFFLTLSMPGIIAIAARGVRGNISEFTVV